MEFDKECLQVFLEKQYKLYDEPVVETMREALDFLIENMAVVVESKEAVVKYFEDNGLDVSGMSKEQIISQAEVFELEKTGRYLIVEG